MDLGIILAVILLFVVIVLLIYILQMKKQLPITVSKAEKDAQERSRPIIKGLVAEQIVPFLEDFKYNPADARFIGAPIDYVIFDGYSDKSDEITVVLADIKTGKRADLTSSQRKIRNAINEKRVKWETIHLKIEDLR